MFYRISTKLFKYILIICTQLFLFGCHSPEYRNDIKVYKDFGIITLKDDQVLYNVLIVKDDTISEIISEVEFQKKYNVPDSLIIQGKGKFLIPSFYEMHAHLQPLSPNHKNYLKDYLRYGVTSLRIMAGNEKLLKWKDSIIKQQIVGPNLKIASPIIDGREPLWGKNHNGPIVSNIQQVDSVVSMFKAKGYDLIKLYERLEKPIYFELLKAAEKIKMPVAAHVPLSFCSTPKIEEVFNSNSPGFEHFSNFGAFVTNQTINSVNALKDYQYYSRELNFNLNPDKVRHLVKQVKLNKIWITPTSVLWRNNADTTTINKITNHNDYKRLDNGLKNWWNSTKNVTKSDKDIANFTEVILEEMARQEVKILAGTDFPNPYLIPGYSLHQEIHSFVDLGYTNLQALKSATVYPAEYWGEPNRTGYLEPGNVANFLILKENPLKEIKNTLSIEKVIMAGKTIEL